MDSDLVAVGDRVALRHWRDSDRDIVFAACQDPEIQRWTTVPVPYTEQHAVDFVGTVAVEQWREAAV